MKTHDVPQGSEAWHKLRLGVPTASNFHKIVTPTGQLSKQARGYMFQLIAERLLGYAMDDIGNIHWVARGKEFEPKAVRAYEFERDVVTAPVGFITTDDGRIGASPDRLILDRRGALELKCPAPQTHVGYMIDGFGADYMPQAQGQLMVGDLEWVDRYSYHPDLPAVLARTRRDEAFIAKLSDALARFCDTLDEETEKLKRRGYFEERERVHRGPGLETAFGLPPLSERG